MSTPSRQKNPSSPYARELIEKEIAHLQNRGSSRYAAEVKRGWSKLIVGCIVLALFSLYAMDPVLFSYNRGNAIRDYLYLHNYGDDQKALALADSGLLTPPEVNELNHRQGAFQDYFTGTRAAEKKADALIAYMQQLHDLHQNHYDTLSPLNKLRFVLFMKTGLVPPIRWDVLNSSVEK